MRFHLPSYLLGVGTAVAVTSTREALRPVVVELGALATQVGRTARALAARQREDIEDLRAEIEERVRQRMHIGQARSAAVPRRFDGGTNGVAIKA